MMRLFISLAVACVLAVALVAACSPQDSSAPASNAGAAQKSQAANAATTAQQASSVPQADDVRRITQDELRAGLESGTVALFDVRDQASYDAGHIKGAKLIPHDDVEKRLAEFPKDKLIVTYCA
jgi:3-mercaptopyruvate sulfurtransferase SseA